jgi:hypothetical protein
MVSVVTHIDGISLKGQFVDRKRDNGDSYEIALLWAHESGCDCEVTHTFTCSHCGRRFGWCLGGTGEMPDACNFCWFAKIGSKR